MIIIDNTILSDDIRDHHFVCDLIKCKGACCVEGDLGAPLDKEELVQIEASLPIVREYLTKEGLDVIDKIGISEEDEDGDITTTTIQGKECVFAIRDNQNILKCGIEQAWAEGKSKFRKPISCHLYPIRITKYNQYDALNYDRWSICSPACEKGEQLQVPIYKFLKEPLIKKYGQEWYERLETEIKLANEEGIG